MAKIFDDEIIYQPKDPVIIEFIGDEPSQAQKRFRRTSPTYFRLGRKIFYHGKDCNIWADARRFESLITK